MHLVIRGDARRIPLADKSVDCVVTSPPYWGGIRDYGVAGQLGLERDPAAYVAALVAVFREVRRVLASDGVLWLNVGDVYAASGKGGGGVAGDRGSWDSVRDRKGFRMPPSGYKMKDLTLVAFQVADALRRDDWYLRSTIIWRKPTATEPHRADRPAVSHEYLFQLTPSEMSRTSDPGEAWWGQTVWTISPDNDSQHPATMPSELARRCIVISTDVGGIVFDPFAGASTTLAVAEALGRVGVGTELSADYARLGKRRLTRPHAAAERDHQGVIMMPLFSNLD